MDKDTKRDKDVAVGSEMALNAIFLTCGTNKTAVKDVDSIRVGIVRKDVVG